MNDEDHSGKHELHGELFTMTLLHASLTSKSTGKQELVDQSINSSLALIERVYGRDVAKQIADDLNTAAILSDGFEFEDCDNVSE